MTLGRCPLSIFCSRGTPPNAESMTALGSRHCAAYGGLTPWGIPPTRRCKFWNCLQSNIDTLILSPFLAVTPHAPPSKRLPREGALRVRGLWVGASGLRFGDEGSGFSVLGFGIGVSDFEFRVSGFGVCVVGFECGLSGLLWGFECGLGGPVSQKVFITLFCTSQFPHKLVNLFVTSVIIKDKLTDL